MTKIEWTEKTWNPIHGCTKVSEACQNCYAEVMARRLQGNHIKSYENGFKVSRNIDAMKEPYEWKKPSMVFVCSMGDLFHEDVPDTWINPVMRAIEKNAPRELGGVAATNWATYTLDGKEWVLANHSQCKENCLVRVDQAVLFCVRRNGY